MTPFTEEEIWKLHELCFPDVARESVTENFNLVGGVPRLIFLKTSMQIKRKISSVLHAKGEAFIKGFDGVNFRGLTDPEMSYLLVHMVPDPSFEACDEDQPLLAIPTAYILNMMGIVKDNVHQNFRSMIALSGPALQQYRGLLFENLFRSKTLTGDFKLDSLGGFCIYGKKQVAGVLGETRNIKWDRAVLLSNIDDPHFEEDVFYVAASLTQGSIDGFVIVASILYFCQLTVSQVHPIRGDILSELYDVIKKDAEPILITQCALVFVLNSGQNCLLNKVQPLHDKDGKNYVSHDAIPSSIRHLASEQWKMELTMKRLQQERDCES